MQQFTRPDLDAEKWWKILVLWMLQSWRTENLPLFGLEYDVEITEQPWIFPCCMFLFQAGMKLKGSTGVTAPNCLLTPNKFISQFFLTSFATKVPTEYYKWGYEPITFLLSPFAALFYKPILKMGAPNIIATVSWVHLPVTNASPTHKNVDPTPIGVVWLHAWFQTRSVSYSEYTVHLMVQVQILRHKITNTKSMPKTHPHNQIMTVYGICMYEWQQCHFWYSKYLNTSQQCQYSVVPQSNSTADYGTTISCTNCVCPNLWAQSFWLEIFASTAENVFHNTELCYRNSSCGTNFTPTSILHFTIYKLLPMPTVSVGVGRTFETICLSV